MQSHLNLQNFFNSNLIFAVLLSTSALILALDPFASGIPPSWLKATFALPYPSLTVKATLPVPRPATILPFVDNLFDCVLYDR